MKKLATRLRLVLLAVTLLPSCYCWEAAHSSDVQCVAARTIVDCTKSNIQEQIPRVFPLVNWILSGAPSGGMDWNELLGALTSTGFDVIGCTAEQLDNAFSSKVMKMESNMITSAESSDERRAAFESTRLRSTITHTRWSDFKSRNYPKVRFNLPETNTLEEMIK